MAINSRFKKMAAALLTAAALAGSSAAVNAESASAQASSCSWGTNGSRGSWAACGSGSGAFRAWASCRDNLWPNYWYTTYGLWQVPGNISWANCNWHSTRYSYGIQYG